MELSAAMKMLQKTRLIKGPSRRLAAFGDTRIRYHLVSPVEDMEDRSRLREGTVVSERPQILTPDHLRERFQGFDEDARRFGDWLLSSYGDQIRALEYRFRNDMTGSRVLHEKPDVLGERIRADLADASDAAVLLCPDAAWQIAVMKLLLDESRQAFSGHVRELEAKGMFKGPDEKKRDEIEALFRRAASDRSLVGLLGSKLKEYGLFGEYEDRFFALL
jgi:hypothetical protein